MPISQGSKTLPASGSQPTPLAGVLATKSFAISAPSSNAGTVYLGPGGVTTSTGFPLNPGDNLSLDGGGLEDIWLRGTQGDIVIWLAAS